MKKMDEAKMWLEKANDDPCKTEDDKVVCIKMELSLSCTSKVSANQGLTSIETYRF